MSEQRRYTLDEVDQMRKDLEWSYASSFSYISAERSAEIENRIRTYMAAGIDPDEIRKKRDRAIQAAQEQQAAQQRYYEAASRKG